MNTRRKLAIALCLFGILIVPHIHAYDDDKETIQDNRYAITDVHGTGSKQEMTENPCDPKEGKASIGTPINAAGIKVEERNEWKLKLREILKLRMTTHLPVASTEEAHTESNPFGPNRRRREAVEDNDRVAPAVETDIDESGNLVFVVTYACMSDEDVAQLLKSFLPDIATVLHVSMDELVIIHGVFSITLPVTEESLITTFDSTEQEKVEQTTSSSKHTTHKIMNAVPVTLKSCYISLEKPDLWKAGEKLKRILMSSETPAHPGDNKYGKIRCQHMFDPSGILRRRREAEDSPIINTLNGQNGDLDFEIGYPTKTMEETYIHVKGYLPEIAKQFEIPENQIHFDHEFLSQIEGTASAYEESRNSCILIFVIVGVVALICIVLIVAISYWVRNKRRRGLLHITKKSQGMEADRELRQPFVEFKCEEPNSKQNKDCNVMLPVEVEDNDDNKGAIVPQNEYQQPPKANSGSTIV